MEAAKLFETKNNPELIVVNQLGEVLGLLEKASIINLMRKEAEIESKVAVEMATEEEKAIVN